MGKMDNYIYDNRFVIGICDDERYTHIEVSKILDAHAEEKGISISIVDYYSAAELLKGDEKLDVLILDIDMPDMDGIEAGHELRRRNIDYKIIMLTGHLDRFKEAFEIEAFRFAVKPIKKDELVRDVEEALFRCALLNKIKVYKDKILYEIAQKDVLYVEANQSSTLIFTANSEYRSENALSDWEMILDAKTFIRCHKSFIVNMSVIEEIQDRVIRITNGYKVPVSRRYRKQLMMSYVEYDTRWR